VLLVVRSVTSCKSEQLLRCLSFYTPRAVAYDFWYGLFFEFLLVER